MLRATLDGQRVYLFDRCAWLVWADGLTLYRVVCFRRHRRLVSPTLFAHELLHWERWLADGFFAYGWAYVRDWLRHGYAKHPEEQRAYGAQADAAQRPAWAALFAAWRGRA